PDFPSAHLTSLDCPATIWEIATRKVVRAPYGQVHVFPNDGIEPVWAIAVTPDGRTLVTAGGRLSRDDLASGGHGVQDFWGGPFGGGPGGLLGQGRGMPGAMDRLGRPVDDPQVRFWELPRGKPLRLSLRHADAVLALAVSP